MDGIKGFGRFSRVYALLVGLAAATVALSLVMLFSDPKPAEALGEAWYGTVEFQGTGEPVTFPSSDITYTNRDYSRFVAPVSSDQATVFTKVDTTSVYSPPEPPCIFLQSGQAPILRVRLRHRSLRSTNHLCSR